MQAANLEEFFPLHKIHSGESDFNPPRFKPDPDVYLLAAEVSYRLTEMSSLSLLHVLTLIDPM